MKRFQGWPVFYSGVATASVGAALYSGLDMGLIVAGACLIVSGFGQVCWS